MEKKKHLQKKKKKNLSIFFSKFRGLSLVWGPTRWPVLSLGPATQGQ